MGSPVEGGTHRPALAAVVWAAGCEMRLLFPAPYLLIPAGTPRVSRTRGRAVMELVTPRAPPIRQTAPERHQRVIVVNEAAHGAFGTPSITPRAFPRRTQRRERLDSVIVPRRFHDSTPFRHRCAREIPYSYIYLFDFGQVERSSQNPGNTIQMTSPKRLDPLTSRRRRRAASR